MTAAVHARCERAFNEAGNIKVFQLSAQSADCEFLRRLRPGGHVAVRYPDVAGTPRERLYSVTRRQAPNLFEIAVKRTGHNGVSDQLHHALREGSTLPLQYAAGDISVDSVAHLSCVGMIAAGVGITLPIALIRELAAHARDGASVPGVVLLLSIPRVADIPFLHELLELDLTMAWFALQVFVTRERVRTGGQFHAGRPSPDALQLLGNPQAVVICGGHAFAHAWRAQVTSRFPAAEMLVESFTPPAAALSSQPAPGKPPLRLRVAGIGKVIDATPGTSLLDMLERHGVPVRSQCRSGICGSCRLQVSHGECRFEPDFCLNDKDKRSGFALACCTFPVAGEIGVNLNQAA